MVGIPCLLVIIEDDPALFLQFSAAVDEHIGFRIGRSAIPVHLTGCFICLNDIRPA